VKDYARQVVNKAKLMLNMRVPGPGEGPAPIAGETAGAVVSSQPARHTVVITQKDWPGSQTKLEQEAADGYRLTGVTISGLSTADASFLRTNATAAAFQYKLLHTILSFPRACRRTSTSWPRRAFGFHQGRSLSFRLILR